MLTILAATALATCGAQEPAAAQADEAVKQLARAVAQFTQADSYTFTSTSKTERPDGGEGEGRGGGRGGGFGGGEPRTTQGTYQAGLPLLLVSADAQAYKKGDVIVHQNAAGEWEEFDPRSMWGGGGRGGRGGGRGGGQGTPGEGGGMRSLMGMMRVVPPHEMLAGFEEKQATLAHAKEGELDVFTGELTPEAAESMGGSGQRGGGFGGEMKVEGTYRLEVQAGQVTGASFTLERSGNFGDRSFEMTTETRLIITKVGGAELEVPDEVMLFFAA